LTSPSSCVCPGHKITLLYIKVDLWSSTCFRRVLLRISVLGRIWRQLLLIEIGVYAV
jgi:hypothetical protein